MKTARILTFLALCMIGAEVDAQWGAWGGCNNSCYSCGPGYGARASDCGFASTLWEGYCDQPMYGGGCGDTCGGCDTGCGRGCNLLSQLRSRLQSMGGSGSCGTGCGGGGLSGGCGHSGGCGILSRLHSLGGGCGSSCFGRGSSSCGGCGGSMAGWWSSMGASSCGGGCRGGCGQTCGGGLRRHLQSLRGRFQGGCGGCHRRYGSLSGFECMCDNVRNYGSFRSWIGGGPLDSCGLVSYDSYPAGGVDYSYLNHVTQPAAPIEYAQSVVSSEPITMAPVEAAPSGGCGCEGAPIEGSYENSYEGTVEAPMSIEGTTVLGQEDMSTSLYDETHSFEPAKAEVNRDSELIPQGMEEDE